MRLMYYHPGNQCRVFGAGCVTHSLLDKRWPELIALECRSTEEATIFRDGQSIVDG